MFAGLENIEEIIKSSHVSSGSCKSTEQSEKLAKGGDDGEKIDNIENFVTSGNLICGSIRRALTTV